MLCEQEAAAIPRPKRDRGGVGTGTTRATLREKRRIQQWERTGRKGGNGSTHHSAQRQANTATAVSADGLTDSWSTCSRWAPPSGGRRQ